MAHILAQRARKLAWSGCDSEKHDGTITGIRRVGTDSTLGDGDSGTAPTSIPKFSINEDTDAFVDALERIGCVIVEGFTDQDTLRKATQESELWLKTGKTSRPLIQQSPTIRDRFLANDTYQQLCEGFLTVETKKWQQDHQTIEICRPILSSARTGKVFSAAYEDALSRYDTALGTTHESVEKYSRGRDSMLGLLVPSSGTMEVHAVLGSHLLGNDETDLGSDIVEEELKAGEALIVLGSLYHYIVAPASGEAKAGTSLVHSIWSCAGVYRPEEQASSLIDAKERSGYPKVVQERLR